MSCSVQFASFRHFDSHGDSREIEPSNTFGRLNLIYRCRR